MEVLAGDWPMPDGEVDARQEQPKIQSVSDIVSIREYAARNINFLVEGFIAEGTINMLSGDAGSGKTTVASAVASAVERGVPFAGLETQRRPVLMLDGENPLPVVVERFDRLGITDGPNFKVWGGWAPEPPSPFSPIVTGWVRACDPKPLLVIDSLVSFHEGSENDATETRAYMQHFRRLADIGATLILLHHSGKGESAREYRGSSDIKASVDVAYHLANLSDPSALGMLRLKAFKARFSVQPEIILNYRMGQFYIDGRSVSRTNQEILQELLESNAGIQAKRFEDMASEKGVARGKARDFLAAGIVSGAIRVDRGQHNTRFHTWVGASPEGLY
jgi:RecA-family ATPase